MIYSNTIGIDLAKKVFHLVELDEAGKKIEARKCDRNTLIEFLSKKASPSVLVAMEACSTAHYWGQMIQKMGFAVQLIKPSDVKAYAKTRQKNDTNDALSIAKTARDPDMRAVRLKNRFEQQISFLHKRRQQLMEQRIQNTNALRAVLSEFGIEINASASTLIRSAREIVEQAHQDNPFLEAVYNNLTHMVATIGTLQHQLQELDKAIIQLNKEADMSQKLKTIPGIGDLNASILSVSSALTYETDRDFAASLGLVPKQNTSGDKIKLGRITKRGSRYMRMLLIQGARSIILHVLKNKNPTEHLKKWALKKYQELGFNKAAVAVANKLARITWAVMTTQTAYDPSKNLAML